VVKEEKNQFKNIDGKLNDFDIEIYQSWP